MTLRVVLALACLAAALSASSSAWAASNQYLIAVRLARGERIVQHSDLVDRISWRLPAARLEAFRSQGVVIDEELRTTIVVDGVVTSVNAKGAHLRGTATTTVRDVPRAIVTVRHSSGTSIVTPRNTQIGKSIYALEDTPMLDLPADRVSLGSHWITRKRVATTLGSGDVIFDHVVAASDGNRIRVDVSGHGAITGAEYHLPHLLPGTIALRGSAWFDLSSGLIVQESYAIDNTLVKSGTHGEIGFVEHLDADTDVHKEGPSVGRMTLTVK